MKRLSFFSLSLVGIGLVAVAGWVWLRVPTRVSLPACTLEAKLCPDGSAVGRSGPECAFAPCPESMLSNEGALVPSEALPRVVPLDRAEERVTKKPFGMFIDPQTSPVQPERFRGYHTGTDFETFPEESVTDVSIRAVCSGTLVAKRRASGYGGVIVERCELGGETVTVVYGHLALKSVTGQVGDQVASGAELGMLGAAGSADTDGERKHLHLGIHRGESVDIRGYVGRKTDLAAWLNPCDFFCGTKSLSQEEKPAVPLTLTARADTIPFVVQAPGGQWSNPIFQNGCEEASVLMVARAGETTPLSEKETEQKIRELSKLSEKLFGTAVDTSAEDTLTLYRAYTGREDGMLLESVTNESLQAALSLGKILIVPMNGQVLRNPYFTGPGPATHMVVVTGYDAATEEYVTLDPGTRRGAGYRYKQERFLEAIRDYPTGDHIPFFSASRRAIILDRSAGRE